MNVILQTVGTAELLVGTITFVLFLGIIALLGYLFYRGIVSPPESGVRPQDPAPTALTPEMRRTVDWVLSLSLMLVGLGGVVLGAFLTTLADRETIRELVQDDVIQSDVLSNEDLVDATIAVLVWGGIGVAVTGVVILLGGVAVAVYRRRTDSRAKDDHEPAPSMAANALLGAVIAVVASFVPFSPVLGGAAAGYLEQADGWTGVRAGILTGLFLAAPSAIFLGVLALGLVVEGLAFIALMVGIGILFSIAISVAMTAVGGYAGGYLVQKERRRRPKQQEPPASDRLP